MESQRATLSDVTAKKEYGVDRDFIVKDMQRLRLIVVAGPNGSGKTTITEELLRHGLRLLAINFVFVKVAIIAVKNILLISF